MKALVNFRTSLPYLRAIEDLKKALNMKKTVVMEEAIKQLAYEKGVGLKADCQWNQNKTTVKGKLEIYCGVKGDWIPYQACLKCNDWGRRDFG